MSVDVTFMAIRKNDYIPEFEAYLGGDGLHDVIQWSESHEDFAYIDCGKILKLKNAKQVRNFMIWHNEDFYLGNRADECIKFVNSHKDEDYAYMIRAM